MNHQNRSRICLSIIIFLFIVFSFPSSFAQLNSGNLTQYTEKDGLPGVQVNNVLTDKLGYIWTGTINGLARYDGYEFKRFYYDPNDTASIHGLVVYSLFEDHKEQIWIGTSPSFLNMYDPVFKTFRQYDFAYLINRPANVEVDISSMCEDNNGRMYFGVTTFYGDAISSGLLYKDEKDDKLKRFIAPDSQEIQNVYKITKDNSGNVWCLSYSGLLKIDTKGRLTKIRSLDVELRRNNEFPADCVFDKNGHLWMITSTSRLYDFNTETGNYKRWASNIHIASENRFGPKTLIFDKDDNLWMGTDSGLLYFNRKTNQFSVFNNGVKKELEHVPVIALCFDSFGSLWIGTYANGLLKYEDKPQLKSYLFNKANKNSITPGWANAICEASGGKIWIATSGYAAASGINVLDTHTGKIQSITYSGLSPKINDAYSIWEGSPGEFYLSISKALYTFSSTNYKAKSIVLQGAPDTLTINYHLKDSRENEWLCTFTGLYRKDKGTQTFKRYDLSLIKGSNVSSNEITRAIESKKHGLWLITNNGLFLYNYSTDKIVRHGFDKNAGDIFATQDINSFYEDSAGIAWVGTWQGGLSKYNAETKKIKTYTRNEGLPSMSIQGNLADEKTNSLWLSTFEGLSRYNVKTEQFNNFSIADGIQSQLFADGSFLKTSTGLFLFGGSNGITIFNPNEVSKISIPPKVFLTDLKLFNKSIIPGEKSILKKPVYETGRIILAYNQNNLSIEFLAIHYSNPSLNKYSYKLENYDNEWRDVGNQRIAFYPNLPPGEYMFHVKAANDKGVWNEQGATLTIIVNPPWWKTTWAYIVYALLMALIVFAADRYFRRRLVEKEREKNRVRELEQAKEIEKAYYKLEETHEALKATQTQLAGGTVMKSRNEAGPTAP